MHFGGMIAHGFEVGLTSVSIKALNCPAIYSRTPRFFFSFLGGEYSLD